MSEEIAKFNEEQSETYKQILKGLYQVAEEFAEEFNGVKRPDMRYIEGAYQLTIC